MGSRPFPEIRCALCSNPVQLETDPTDENGQAVHEECYVKKVARAEQSRALRTQWQQSKMG